MNKYTRFIGYIRYTFTSETLSKNAGLLKDPVLKTFIYALSAVLLSAILKLIINVHSLRILIYYTPVIFISLLLAFISRIIILNNKERHENSLKELSLAKSLTEKELSNNIKYLISLSLLTGAALSITDTLYYGLITIFAKSFSVGELAVSFLFTLSFFSFGMFSYLFLSKFLFGVKESLFEIENYFDGYNNKVKIPAIIFAVLFPVVFAAAAIITKKPLLSLAVTFITSLVISISTGISAVKLELYNAAKRKLLFKKARKFFISFFNIASSNRNPINFYNGNIRLPAIIFIVIFPALLILNNIFIRQAVYLVLSQSLIISLFFTFGITKYFFKYETRLSRPFTLNCFIFAVILINTFIINVKIPTVFKAESILNSFKDFLIPPAELINNYAATIKSAITGAGFFLPPAILLLFIISFIITFYLYKLFFIIEKKIDLKLVKKRVSGNSSLIFGDSLSLYPLIFFVAVNGFVVILLSLELPVIAKIIYTLFKTLEVESIFKISLLSETNIKLFFNIILYAAIIAAIYKSLKKLIYQLFSHMMLFNDEIIIIEKSLLIHSETRIPLNRVNSIKFTQNIVEKLLDIGNIIIETSDKGNSISVRGISGIKNKNKLIMEKIKVGIQQI